jgi:hypothetical protein
MKKIFLLSLSLFVFAFFVKAQQQPPNAGFEDWTAGYPDGYVSFDQIFGSETITQSTDAHGGSYSVKINSDLVEIIQGFYLPAGFLFLGDVNSEATGVPFTSRPTALTGWYKCDVAAGDSAFITAGVSKYNLSGDSADQIGVGFQLFTGNVDTWTQFTAPFDYVSTDIPDTLNIIITVGTSLDSTVESEVWIDDLAFTYGSVGFENVATNNSSFVMYPNPSNGAVQFLFNDISNSTLQLMDVTGRVVYTEIVTANSKMKVADLPNGVYTVRLLNGNTVSKTEKLIINK